jgi:dienelactone hydrolase
MLTGEDSPPQARRSCRRFTQLMQLPRMNKAAPAAGSARTGGSRLRCLWTIMREVTAGKGHTVAGIDAARDWLAARVDCTGRIAVIGFCMGGGYALALAAGHGYGRPGGRPG